MSECKIERNKCNILVTRPEAQAENLSQLIEQQGWTVIRFPTLEIVALETTVISQQLITLNEYDWLIFISVNAVNFALAANNGKIDVFKHCSIAAVGKSTEKALQKIGLSVSLIPETQFNSEGLLATVEMNNVSNKSCLIVRGKGGRATLANTLRERGAQVDYLEVYTREQPEYSDEKVIQLFQHDKIQAITMTSGDALNNLMSMIDVELHANVYLVPLIVISNRLKELAQKMGFKHITIAKSPDDSAITAAVLLSLSSQ